MTAPAGMLTGDRIYRVHWLPGTDTLRGICHCGAENIAEEPVGLWEWLLAHPEGHRAPEVPPPPATPEAAPPAADPPAADSVAADPVAADSVAARAAVPA